MDKKFVRKRSEGNSGFERRSEGRKFESNRGGRDSRDSRYNREERSDYRGGKSSFRRNENHDEERQFDRRNDRQNDRSGGFRSSRPNDARRSFSGNRDQVERSSRFERNDERRGDRREERGNRYSNDRPSFQKRSFNRDDRSDRREESGRFQGRREGQYDSDRGQRRDSRPMRDARPSRDGRPTRDSRPSRDSRGGFNKPQGRFDRGQGRSDDRGGRGFGQRRSPRSFDYDNEISSDELDVKRARHYSKKKILEHNIKSIATSTDAELRLNRYIAISGICSRRDADELIESGRVRVNGVVVDKVGIKVSKKDKVEVDGEEIIPEKKVYLVLNKPKDFVTTMDDPLERKTVMNLIGDACKERIYPVGRLDRQTTGVLLFTNDGDLAKKLTHPSFEHKKIYHVFLDRAISPEEMEQISKGITLEDGVIKADEIEYASEDGTQVGIEIHSGRNRIVRRIFEHLGYRIEKLDRVYFAGITKKNIPRGKWRMLSKAEVDILKFY